jgi:hypothetical protein
LDEPPRPYPGDLKALALALGLAAILLALWAFLEIASQLKGRTMNDTEPSAIPAYLASMIRTGLTALGGYLVGKGFLTAEQAPEVAGAVLTGLSAVWSLYQKWSANQKLSDAIAAPAGKAK